MMPIHAGSLSPKVKGRFLPSSGGKAEGGGCEAGGNRFPVGYRGGLDPKNICMVVCIVLLVIFPVVFVVEYLPIRFVRPACMSPSASPSGPPGRAGYNNKNSNVRERDGWIRYRHTKRRLPTCLIIGVRKSGTRALLEFLNIHPGLQAARKEIHFFDNDENFAMGSDWYRRRMPFSFPGQVIMEKTPKYFTEPLVPERVKRMNESIKMLLIVREPVDRAISDYTQVCVVLC